MDCNRYVRFYVLWHCASWIRGSSLLRYGQRLLRYRAQGWRSFHQSDASAEFADFILEIAERYSAADTIHPIVDNLSTHTRKALVDRFGEVAGGWLWDRFTVHYAPKHGSWLNQAEIEIGIFSRQCLGKRRIGDIATLRRQAKAWNRRTNRDKLKIKWKFTRKLARLKLNY